MEQKDYKLEIVNELLKSKNHIRGIAKNLNTNHMTVLRKVNALFKENAVDYIEEGKNKVYFLKNSVEAKNYIFMAENYKLSMLLKKYPHLRGIIEKIQKDGRIKLAVIFGSYAKGIAKLNSDIDIYIETMDNKLKQEIEIINARLSIKIGKYDKSNLLIKEIEKNHVVIKGVERYYEEARFFE